MNKRQHKKWYKLWLVSFNPKYYKASIRIQKKRWCSGTNRWRLWWRVSTSSKQTLYK